MRITSIELAGEVEKGKGQNVPRDFAKIGRKPDNAQIEVTILTAGSERTHHVQADCEEDVWSMAECLQYQLDGHKGTNSMIHEYFRLLQHFAD